MPDEIQIEFTELRNACGVTQPQFAAYLKTDDGRSVYSLSRIEHGLADDVARANALRVMVGTRLFQFGIRMVEQRKREEAARG